MEKPWLGLYLIMKDAGATIERLLASVNEVVDELVIVDTGSSDGTQQVIAKWFGVTPGFWGGGAIETAGHGRWTKPVRLVLANFTWVDDFSAARQFSFELGTAKWRMYLDADDVAEFQNLRPTLARTERESPQSNIVSLKYDYLRDEVAQDKLRLVRWADGWKWEDPVHEHLVPIGHGRVISKYLDVWVRHLPADPASHFGKSGERNIRIIEKAYNEPTCTKEKKALWAYYLAKCAGEVGQIDLARRYYREAADGLGRTNLACDGLVQWARMELRQGNFDRAILIAGEAFANAPELPDGLSALAVANTMAGAYYRAAGLFDSLKAQPPPPVETQHDAVFLDGITWAWAAAAYYRIGRIADANAAIARIPEAVMKHPEVKAIGSPTNVSIAKSDGFSRLQALWEFLIWDTEPLKAKRLLQEFCPAALSDSPQVKALIRQTDEHMPHMRSWGDYQRTYAAIPEFPYHVPPDAREWTLKQGRARMVRQWAEATPKEGLPLEVLVIGVQDGIIEGAMMEANPRIVLTACDVAPQASKGINELKERFPGRVKTHQVKRSHYDWFPGENVVVSTIQKTLFDAIIFFEVIEHLPEEGDFIAMTAFRSHLKEDGKLFLSTPIASQWVEQYLSDMKSTRPWWHVRAHNPSTLWYLAQRTGFTGSLMGLGDEALFLASFTPTMKWEDEVSIWVYPLAHIGGEFDPFTAKQKHLGGSEEAVIHLSAALARAGCRVTVFTDMPKRKDTVFVFEGVQWKTHAEFDVQSVEGTLLVWRAPQAAAQFKRQNPRARVLNWLHDTTYEAKPEQYEAVDGTIVLSDFHAQAVQKYDGYGGPFLYAGNGIDPREFPEPDESKRVSHSCIYAAAPERGLELLLEAWPTVRAAVPDATLNVYYSWAGTEKMLERRPNAELSRLLLKLRANFEALKEHGVTYHGGVSHQALNDAYRASSLWTFPPIHFDEIFCISALRAQAAGCWPVIVPTGALPETCPVGTHVKTYDALEYAQKVIGSLEYESTLSRTAGRLWALTQSWDATAEKFIKHFRAKNERITIFAGGFGRKFDGLGSADGRPLGGSEEAVVRLAEALDSRGHEVFVYCNLPEGGVRENVENEVMWRDASTFDPAGPHGTLLAWRCPKLVPKLKGNGYPVILWLMDPEYGAPSWDYEEADEVVFLTISHAKTIELKDGYSGKGSVVHIGLPELPALTDVQRVARSVMWATSPDRGLLEFLQDVWPEVISQVPDARLHIFYGLEPLIAGGKPELARAIELEMKESTGVIYHGGVSNSELCEWYQRCSVFAFRCIGFEETLSISTLKAMALGCFPLVNDTGCLQEVTGASGYSGTVVDSESGFATALIGALMNPVDDSLRLDVARRIRERFSIDSMATCMLEVIDTVNYQAGITE